VEELESTARMATVNPVGHYLTLFDDRQRNDRRYRSSNESSDTRSDILYHTGHWTGSGLQSITPESCYSRRLMIPRNFFFIEGIQYIYEDFTPIFNLKWI
jgi:hypothetical protein